MPKFKNVSPLGAIEIPALGKIVEAGEEFELPDSVPAEAFVSDNFEPIDSDALAAFEAVAEAAPTAELVVTTQDEDEASVGADGADGAAERQVDDNTDAGAPPVDPDPPAADPDAEVAVESTARGKSKAKPSADAPESTTTEEDPA